MRRWRPEIGRSSSSFVAALLGPSAFPGRNQKARVARKSTFGAAGNAYRGLKVVLKSALFSPKIPKGHALTKAFVGPF